MIRSWRQAVRTRGLGPLAVSAALALGVSNLLFAWNAVTTARTQQASLNRLSDGIDCRARVDADVAIVDYRASIEDHQTEISYYRALIAQRAGESVTDTEVLAFVASVDGYAAAVEALRLALDVRLETIGACL